MWVAIYHWYGNYEEAATVYGLFTTKKVAETFAENLEKRLDGEETWEFTYVAKAGVSAMCTFHWSE